MYVTLMCILVSVKKLWQKHSATLYVKIQRSLNYIEENAVKEAIRKCNILQGNIF